MLIAETTATTQTSRDPAIDRLKGLAILFVFLIHAEPLRGYPIHIYLVDRAVPIFVVLFGITSHRWWVHQAPVSSGRRVLTWYRQRLRRLLPAAWGVLAVWWLLSAILSGFPTATPVRVAVSLLGYAPWLGMFWFVTLIFQLIVLYPLLQSAYERFGRDTAIAASAVVAVGAHLAAGQVIGFMRWVLCDSSPGTGFFEFYYLWIFAPQYFVLVFAGMAMAASELKGRLLPMALAYATGALLHAGVASHMPLVASAILRLCDVVLCGTLLALFRLPAFSHPAFGVLTWFGRRSWSLYLGQALLHDIAFREKIYLGSSGEHERWFYALALIITTVVVRELTVRTVRQLRRMAPTLGIT